MNYNNQTAAAGWTCSGCLEFVPMNQSHTCPTIPYEPGVIPLEGWTAIVITLKEHREAALKDALSAFEQRLSEHRVQMPPEFTELVSKHFWDLI